MRHDDPIPRIEPDVLEQSKLFPFQFDPRLRPLLAPLRIDREQDGVWVDTDTLTVTFGPFTVHTRLSNVAGSEVTGPYSAWRVTGPRVSLVDRGLTFGTNTSLGVCIRFHRPVRGIEPFGLLRHPALTVTVTEPQLLARRLRHDATELEP